MTKQSEKLEPKQYAAEMALKMREAIEKGDEAMPITFVVGEDNKIAVIGTPFSGERSKDAAAVMMRQMANQIGTRFVVFISDSWTKIVGEGEEVDTSQGLKNIPGRTEAIVISIFGREIGPQPIVGTWNYGRDKDQRPVFESEIKWMDKKGHGFEGRFVPGGRKRAEAQEIYFHPMFMRLWDRWMTG